MSPREWHRLNPKSIQSMTLTRAPPRTNTQVILMSIGLHRLDLKSMQIKANTNPGPDMCLHLQEDQSSVPRHRSSKPSRKAHSDQDQPQHDPDPPYYREVALSDVPSQYAECVDTFRRSLNLPDPREPMPRFSTAVMGLDDKKGRQELRPRGPSSMLPLNSVIKDAFDKFDHDFQTANLPEGKYIKAPPSTAKWYKVAQPCYEDKISGVEYRFCKNLYYS